MNGPSEFHVIGSIKDWQSKDRLAAIAVPTLARLRAATTRRHRRCRSRCAMASRGAEWVLFEESSHMPHLEERERYMQVVGDWLARHDG